MTTELSGKEVADRLTEETAARVEKLKEQGIEPTLAILRIGEKPGDLYYEKGAVKRAEKTGVAARQIHLPEEVTQDRLLEEIRGLNGDAGVDGVLILRPLPSHINEDAVCRALSVDKDVDGITPGSMAGVFMGSSLGFAPCTAEACMVMLDHYGVELRGKRVTVMGRSLVIGKPVALMAMARHATVTVLHSRTEEEDFRRAVREADVVIAAMGRAKMIGADLLGEDQIVLDVGINEDEEGNLCGDVDYSRVREKTAMITPVPGGVGSVTTAVLMEHVVRAAERWI